MAMTADKLRTTLEYIEHHFPSGKLCSFLKSCLHIADNMVIDYDHGTDVVSIVVTYNTEVIARKFSKHVLYSDATLEDNFVKEFEECLCDVINRKRTLDALVAKPSFITPMSLGLEELTNSISPFKNFATKPNVDEDDDKNKVATMFTKIMKEISERGDYEIDIVTFVDILIKLGIAKPKD